MIRWWFARLLKGNHTTVINHLYNMGKVKKRGTWESAHLKQNKKASTFAANFLARHKHTNGHKERFLYRIITDDENGAFKVPLNTKKHGSVPIDKQHHE